MLSFSKIISKCCKTSSYSFTELFEKMTATVPSNPSRPALRIHRSARSKASVCSVWDCTTSWRTTIHLSREWYQCWIQTSSFSHLNTKWYLCIGNISCKGTLLIRHWNNCLFVEQKISDWLFYSRPFGVLVSSFKGCFTTTVYLICVMLLFLNSATELIISNNWNQLVINQSIYYCHYKYTSFVL